MLVEVHLHHTNPVMYLRDFEQGLGNIHNAAQLLYVVNSGFDSLSVIGTSRVQDVSDLVGLCLRPLLIHRSTIFDNTAPNAQQAEHNDGFLVNNIVLVAESVDCDTSAGGENGSLGDQGVAW